MSNNKFFKPTILYKEFMILDLIEKNSKITQREISNTIKVSVAMVNGYLDGYEKCGYIQKKYFSQKTVEYLITKEGIERRKVLNLGYLHSSQMLYNFAKDNIEKFLVQMKEKGFCNLLLYGAGEVAEILLQTIKTSKNIDTKIVGIVDDSLNKQNTELLNVKIVSRDSIKDYVHDGILISSYTHKDKMRKKLDIINYPSDKIIEFFES